MHLARLKRTGTLGGYKAIYNYDKICTVDICNEKYTNDWTKLCDLHQVEHRKKVRKESTERLHYYTEYSEIDYQDMWDWMKKEIKGEK